MTDAILSILVALLGGCNIFQFIFWRAEKKKHEAEAESVTVDVQTKIKELHQDAYEDLVERLNKYQKEYFELGEKMQSQTREFMEKINNKCNEIAELKSQVVYFKGLRCYKSDCSLRVTKNPKRNDSKRDTEKQD